MIRIGSYPRLLDQKTGHLKFIQAWLLANRWKDTKNSPGLNQTVAALALLIDMELRFRDHRRKPLVLQRASPSGGVER